MPYGYGRGFGFRGSSPPWPYVGRGRGGLPRCMYPWAGAPPPYWPTAQSWQFPYPDYGAAGYVPQYGDWPEPGTVPYAPQMSREQELEFLKSQAELIKSQLEQIDSRIQELGTEEK